VEIFPQEWLDNRYTELKDYQEKKELQRRKNSWGSKYVQHPFQSSYLMPGKDNPNNRRAPLGRKTSSRLADVHHPSGQITWRSVIKNSPPREDWQRQTRGNVRNQGWPPSERHPQQDQSDWLTAKSSRVIRPSQPQNRIAHS